VLAQERLGPGGAWGIGPGLCGLSRTPLLGRRVNKLTAGEANTRPGAFSHIVLNCKGSWKKANPPRGGDAKLTGLFPKEVAGLPKGGAMGKIPRVGPQQPSAYASLPKASVRYFVGGHRHANPFNPYAVGCPPEEVETLWREVLALVARRRR
jgi:hypothetical protein